MYEELLKYIPEKIYDYAINFVAALAILFLGKWLAGILTGWVEKVMRKTKVDRTLILFSRHIIYYGMLIFVVVAALNRLGVQTTSIITILGAASIAVGLALQGSLSNIASGLMIVAFRPFVVGDFIEAGDESGFVKEVQLFNTIITTRDNKRIILPNSKITTNAITNYTGMDKRRVDLVFGISYDDDIIRAKEVLRNMVLEDPRVLKDQPPKIAVKELGDSSVNITCWPWVKPEDYWDVYFDMLEKGKLSLEAAGMTIPYPQRDVHLYRVVNDK